MKEFKDLVALRRSMRKFTPDTLPADDVALILRAALMSPSSKGKRCPEYVLVDDKHVLEELSHCKTVGSDFLANASLAVVVCAQPEKSDVWIEDCSVACMQMMLQAEDLNIGSCWIQVRERKDAEGRSSEELVRQALHIPADRRILSIIALGYKGMERKPQDEGRLHWENVHTDQW
ncbi:MAG: nitroreductase family protein [Bacteroidaceae bacterium]|nr:nitroreductase family protein [Bacteroidaceae bacterium]